MKCGENKSRLINLIYEVISSDYKRALALLKCNEIFFLKKDSLALIQSSIQDAVTKEKLAAKSFCIA